MAEEGKSKKKSVEHAGAGVVPFQRETCAVLVRVLRGLCDKNTISAASFPQSTCITGAAGAARSPCEGFQARAGAADRKGVALITKAIV